MPDHPTGTVTFLFTDIEASTPRWERTPTGWRRPRPPRGDSAGRSRPTRRDLQDLGDAFQAAFPTPGAALTAAIAAQRALAADPWGDPEPLTVRMALHTGAAEERTATTSARRSTAWRACCPRGAAARSSPASTFELVAITCPTR